MFPSARNDRATKLSCMSRKNGKSIITVKPVQKGHPKIDKTKILMTNGSLMKVKSIAECSPWSLASLTLQESGSIHDSMKIPKIEFIS